MRDVYWACGHCFPLWVRRGYGAEPLTRGTTSGDLLGFIPTEDFLAAGELRCFTSVGWRERFQGAQQSMWPGSCSGCLAWGGLSEATYSFVQITRFPSVWPSAHQGTQLGSRGPSEPGPQRDTCVWGRFPGCVDTKAGAANFCPPFITGNMLISLHVQLKGLSFFTKWLP